MKIFSKSPVLRIVFLGLSVAMYIALSFVSIDLQVFKITVSALPIIFVAILYGPIDGMLVGLIGEFIAQATSKYGLTITTPLWLIPAVTRGLTVGLLFKHKRPSKNIVMWIATIVISSLLVTTINTIVIYLDAKIFGYPSGLTYLIIIFRFVGSIVSAVIYGIIIPLLFEALIKTNFIIDETK